MRSAVIAIGIVVLAGHAAHATVEDLDAFLRSAEQAGQVVTPVRGDGQFQVTSAAATRNDQVAVIVRPPADTYIELHQAGLKVLLPSQSADASLFKPGDSKAESLPLDGSVADSDFTGEDLLPFRLSNYKQPRISDESDSEITVTLFPTMPPYSLIVITFDRDKKLPRKTLYYRETLNNLVKMRRDDDYVLIGRKWLPTTMSMETFKLRTRTTFTLQWSQDANVPPELFDPVFLLRPSGINWPTSLTPAAK